MVVSRRSAFETGRDEPQGGGTPIAVVGMSCRLPQSSSPEELWQLLANGRDAITEIPNGRFGPGAFAGYDLTDGDRKNMRCGGYLDRIGDFDSEFFGISPREATAMDPQQRLALELAWEALENAGIVPGTIAAGAGVFLGVMADDYAKLALGAGARTDQHSVTGLQRSIIANRVSYALGLRGPSLVVDTGQSSSLVAVHLACESLRSGESGIALAGGINLNIAPQSALATSRFGALSPDGRCFTFDARANGYVRGEGGGIVVLKTLESAWRDGDRIIGVIRGSAVNNDGDTRTLTTPDPRAQQEVIEHALARAGCTPDAVQYVELHGTGTRVGDPMEAAALGAALGRGRTADRPLVVGSVKTNIGHLEGAAGIAGLIKTLLCIQHQKIPASLNFTEPNPDIPLEDLRLQVRSELGPWPDSDRPAVAGVSAFGMGGTNCHLVLTAPEPLPAQGSVGDSTPAAGLVPWILSGKSEAALRAQAKRLGEYAEVHDVDIRAAAGTLALGRTSFDCRGVVVGAGREELLEGLAVLAEGGAASGVVRGRATGAEGGPAFLFSGQGSQRLGMGRQLYERFPVFADAFDEACSFLDPLLGRSLREVVFGGGGVSVEGLLDRTVFTQAGLFALEVALFRLVGSWGVRPDFVMGHSVGELAAAHCAGVLSLGDACVLVAARGRLMQGLPAGGAMVSVRAPEAEVVGVVGACAGRVSVAAVNGPDSTVVSGDVEVVEEIAALFRGRGCGTKRLRVSHAFHSPLMEPMLGEFRGVAEGLTYHAPSVPLVSNVTGAVVGDEVCDPEYWVRHVRETVRFSEGMLTLDSLGVTTYLELGPDGVLAGLGRECLPEVARKQPERAAPLLVPLLRRGRSEQRTSVTALAELHSAGGAIDWGAVFEGMGARTVSLPTYAFRTRRYWLRGSTAGPVSSLVPLAPEYDEQPDDKPNADPAEAFAARLDGLTDDERMECVGDLVAEQVAGVLGLDGPEDVDRSGGFLHMGFDSLTAVELRNRLRAATGLELPVTMIFDCPTPAALTGHILAESTDQKEEGVAS